MSARPEGAQPAELLQLEGLSVRYPSTTGEVRALQEVQACLGSGSIVGLFGNNGAGKTTLMRTIAGLVEPSSGGVRIAGELVQRRTPRTQRELGLCSAEDRSFYPRLSVRENLLLFGRLQGLGASEARARIEEQAARFDLGGILDRPFQACSSGQRQRSNLVRGLLHEPRILMLDEAARSADPALVEALRAYLQDYVRPGRLVLYASHELEGIELLCDRILVLDHGRLLLSGGREEVLSRLVDPAWKLVFASRAAREDALRRCPSLRPGPQEDSALHPLGPGSGLPDELAGLARESGAELVSIERRTRLAVRELLLQLARGEGAGAARPEPARAAPHSAVAPAESVAPASAPASTLAVLSALFRRDRLIHTSHRFRMLLQTALMIVWATLFFCVSKLIDPEDARLQSWLHGGYFPFVLFGLAGMQVSQVCLLHMGRSLREEQLQGTLEPLLASGHAPLLLLLASLVWPLFLCLASMAILIGGGALLFAADLSRADWPAVALATALSVLTLSALGVLSAAFVLAFKRGDPVAVVLDVAALLLGGVYFPVELLPAFVRSAAQALPITHGLRAVRAAALDGAALGSEPVARSLLSLLLLAALLLPLARWGCARAVRYGRRRGSIGHS